MKKNSTGYTNWNQLPYDILVRILMSLNIIDLLSGISGVCRSWRAASSDPMIWEKTDFNTLKSDLVNTPKEISVLTDRRSSAKYLWILKRALDLSRGSVTHLSFHNSVHLKNEHLLCAAQRTPNLKRLVLSTRNTFSIAGFEEAVKLWKDLETLTVTCAHFPYIMMKCIGTHCKNLTELAIMCNLDVELAMAIVTNIPQLKVLNLQYSSFYKEGLLYLMKNLKHLETLNISHAVQVANVRYGNNQFMIYVDLDKEIIENGLRMGKFVNCQNENCPNHKHPHGKIMYLIGD